MVTASIEHIIFLVISIAFLVGTCFAVSKMSKKWQNVMFVIAVVIGCGGIFFRYAMNLSFKGQIRIDTLLIQTMQVCNFNFILLPLMLVPKLKLARQYSVFFAMFAASTTMLSFPKSYAGYEWYDLEIINFWLNHLFAVALPLWMMSAKRLYPDKKYIIKVTVCVFAYFTLVFLLTEWFISDGILPQGSSFSYVHNPKGMPIITTLYNLIGLPYVHLLPLLPVVVGIFYLWSMPFNKNKFSKSKH